MDSRVVGRLAVYTAFGILSRMAFLWAPNITPLYFVVVLAGIVHGALFGAAVGILSMTITNLLISGLHPVLLVNGPAMAALGVVGGTLGKVPFLFRRPKPTLLDVGISAFLGWSSTLVFSVLADTLTYVLFLAPSGASRFDVWRALVVAGLFFNALPALTNLVLFALALPPSTYHLRRL